MPSRLYVVEATMGPGLQHHANILFTYMQVLQELEQQFGPHMPDVEFVVASSDRPMVLRKPPPSPPADRPPSPGEPEGSGAAEGDVLPGRAGRAARARARHGLRAASAASSSSSSSASSPGYPPVLRFCSSAGKLVNSYSFSFAFVSF